MNIYDLVSWFGAAFPHYIDKTYSGAPKSISVDIYTRVAVIAVNILIIRCKFEDIMLGTYSRHACYQFR